MRKPNVALVVVAAVGLVGCGGGSGGVNKTSMKIYVQQKLYDKAIANGRRALATNPNDGDTNYFMGVSFYAKDGELKTESATYADSSEQFVKSAFDYFQKSKQFAAGQWGKSADDNIVSMFGRHFNRGVIAGKKGDNATAALEYRLATIADPENYQGYLMHGYALWPLALDAQKNKDEAKFNEMADAALKDLDKVLELKPPEKDKVITVYQTRGDIQYRRGMKKESMESFQKAVELDPENYELLCTIGQRFFNDSDWESAAEYLGSCLAVQERLNLIDAEDADTYSIMGEIRTKQEKWQEALEGFDKALTLKPDDAEGKYNILVTHFKFGKALETDNKMDEAKVQYNEGIKIGTELIQANTTEAKVYQVVGYCKIGIGDNSGAAIMLKKFRELSK
jgi:tetratricopeptide (TPR) repeat protein